MFTKSKDHNQNYLASIVKIDAFRPHPNADKLKITTLYGNSVITGIQAEPGLYCYFPLECSLSQEFLSYTNSFRDSELNLDKTKKGMFENSGRVRAIKLRGSPSEGYIIPVSVLEDFSSGFLKAPISITDKFCGTDFDLIGDHQICQKYIPRGQRISGAPGKKSKGNTKRYESKLVENQFKFHYDTAHLKREINKIRPNDLIAITNKIHGANFIVANVLTKKHLGWKDKIAKFFGVRVQETEYGLLYSSRAVIKNSTFNDEKENNHFYDADIWKIVADRLFPSLKEGITAIGEVYGYTPSGSFIQKNYDYGCSPGHLDYVVFRMTYTNPKGDVFEFSHKQVQEYCARFGIKTPETYYHGYAKDLFDLDTENHWHENFLNKMIETYLEKDCHLCKSVPGIPSEGVILRNDSNIDWEVYKLKSFRFLQKESEQLDTGVIDIETQEANNENVSE
jgi:hypothetical protein